MSLKELCFTDRIKSMNDQFELIYKRDKILKMKKNPKFWQFRNINFDLDTELIPLTFSNSEQSQ